MGAKTLPSHFLPPCDLSYARISASELHASRSIFSRSSKAAALTADGRYVAVSPRPQSGDIFPKYSVCLSSRSSSSSNIKVCRIVYINIEGDFDGAATSDRYLFEGEIKTIREEKNLFVQMRKLGNTNSDF